MTTTDHIPSKEEPSKKGLAAILNKKTPHNSGAAFLLGLLIGIAGTYYWISPLILNWPVKKTPSGEFSIHILNQNTAIKVNKLTGETWMMRGTEGVWRPLRE